MGFPYTFPFDFEGVTFDSTYELGAGNHNFFERGGRKRLVIPNKVIVKSHPNHDDQYEGYATSIESYQALGRYITSRPYYIRATSNDICTSIASAIIKKAEVEAERGHGLVPMNCGQEVFDYVKIIDSISGETRKGAVSYISRKYIAGKKYEMTIRFGALSGEYPFLTDMTGSSTNYVTWDAWGELISYVDQKDMDLVDVLLGGIDGGSIINGTITLSDKIYGNLDDIADGTSYSKVLTTDISAGHILLSEATGDLDDIVDGSTYGRLLITDISSGHIKLTSSTVVSGEWYSSSGVEISASTGIDIYGTNMAFTTSKSVATVSAFADYSGTVAGTVKCTTVAAHGLVTGDQIVIRDAPNYNGKYACTVIDATSFYFTQNWSGDDAAGTIYQVQCSVDANGKITAGISTVLLDNDGISIKDSSDSNKWLRFIDSGDNVDGYILLSASDHLKIWAENNLLLESNTADVIITAANDIGLIATGYILLTSSDYIGFNSSNHVGITAPDGIYPAVMSAAPPSPTAGCMYYDTDDNKLKVYNGAGWQDCY